MTMLGQDRDQFASVILSPSNAENVCWPPAPTVASVGLTLKVLEFVSETVADAVFVVSALEIAVTVTAVAGTAPGAV
jgi:hypothetical protein